MGIEIATEEVWNCSGWDYLEILMEQENAKPVKPAANKTADAQKILGCPVNKF